MSVGGGTFYAFQPGPPTGLEYAAENANAWKLLVDEFMGGVDYVPACP